MKLSKDNVIIIKNIYNWQSDLTKRMFITLQ